MRTATDEVFAALADATRRRLLVTLAANSPRTATELTREFSITRQGIIKHLEMLAAAGLVRAQAQGRERRYTLSPEPLDEVAAWLNAIGVQWEGRLARLKELLEGEG